MCVVACTAPEPVPTAASSAPAAALTPADDVVTVPQRVRDEVRRCFAADAHDGVVWSSFAAFGPPAMAHDLLGQAWWSWDAEGHAMDAAGGQVLVAVVDKERLDWARKTLAPQPAKQCDVRVVERAQVMSYVQVHLADLHDVDAAWAGSVRRQLQALRQRLQP